MTEPNHAYVRMSHIGPRDHSQLVYCPRCDYAKHITVQNPKGSHGCMACGGSMEVWVPRPQRHGGLMG